MKQSKLEALMAVSRLKLFRVGMMVLFLYLLLMSLEIPLILRETLDDEDAPRSHDRHHPITVDNLGDFPKIDKASRSFSQRYSRQASDRRTTEFKKVSGLVFDEMPFANGSKVFTNTEGRGRRVVEGEEVPHLLLQALMEWHTSK